ncbi:hypothetical protein ACFSTA_01380 [Ornithinibacillus salinisoli]|uniref:Glycosyltransferase n=1 Tax=Ornithinibacillus salinisoli TaxID=1848459 RepID=A0ABW4VTF8_9BACI
MTNVSLITVLHDPSGNNINLFKDIYQEIENIYSDLFITVSDETSMEWIKALQDSKFNVKVIPKKGAANARREVVKFGLSNNSDHYHYGDFDRILAW